MNVRPCSRVGSIRYRIAPKCSLSGPFCHSGVGRNPGVAGLVRSYDLVFTYPCQRVEGGSERRQELVVLALFASLVISNVLSVPLSLGVGLILGESFPRPVLVALMLLVGFVVHGPPVFGWRLGVMLGRYAGIGVLIHVSTLLTLGWYWLLSLAAVSYPGYLAVGVLMVVSSGVLAQVQGWVLGLLRWPFRLGGRLLR